jgi:Rad3-related DNA helicase
MAYEKAKQASLLVTNYSYWCAIHAYGEGLGQFGLLACDEAHDCGDAICNAVACEVTSREVYQILGGEYPTPEESQTAWQEWATHHLPEADARVRALGDAIRNGDASSARLSQLRQWKALHRKLQSLAGMLGPWIVEATRHGFRLDPLWPSQYAEKVLFLGIPRVVLYSATLRPKTAGLLGIPNTQMTFWEYPSSFPPANSPIIHIPTVVMDRHADAGVMALWMSRIDQVIGGRGDRKGIVHTVSYARRDFVLGHSRYADRMLAHDSDDTQQVVERFKREAPASGAVLVSPSLSTGYDFPGPSCEYQVIAKIPYPDDRSALMQARKRDDKEYILYLTGQSLVQVCGRACRSETDKAENLVVDDTVRRFLAQYGHELPEWWKRRYRRSQVVPEPPASLGDGQ